MGGRDSACADMLGLAAAGALIAAVSCGSQGSAVVDLMDGYYRFVDTAAKVGPDARVTAFREHVLERNPSFTAVFLPHSARLLAPARAVQVDRMLERLLELEGGIRQYHARFVATEPFVRRDVARVLDDRVYSVPVYLTVGLFSSNAQVRHVDGAPAIMVGPDALAHDDATIFSARTEPDLRPLLAHEFFHAWQLMENPFAAKVAERSLPPESDAPVWAILWLEGLAGCFSRIVYPDASIHRVLSVEGIWDEAEPRLGELAAQILPHFGSTDPGVISDWFYLSSTREDIPRKAGYILGLVVMHAVVAEMGFESAARLEEVRARRAVLSALRRVASGDVDVTSSNVCVP